MSVQKRVDTYIYELITYYMSSIYVISNYPYALRGMYVCTIYVLIPWHVGNITQDTLFLKENKNYVLELLGTQHKTQTCWQHDKKCQVLAEKRGCRHMTIPAKKAHNATNNGGNMDEVFKMWWEKLGLQGDTTAQHPAPPERNLLIFGGKQNYFPPFPPKYPTIHSAGENYQRSPFPLTTVMRHHSLFSNQACCVIGPEYFAIQILLGPQSNLTRGCIILDR